MTEDDFLTLTLPNRIKWLHGPKGPHGKLSHDKFAKLLNTSRQTVISWENGAQPREVYRGRLSSFSGFRPEVFSRREAEALEKEMVGRRLRSLEEQAGGARQTLRAVLAALAKADIQVPLDEAALGFLATPGSHGQVTP